MSKKERLLTYNDFSEDLFSEIADDKNRIKYVSKAYKNLNLSKAFQIYYGLEISAEVAKNTNINKVYTLEIGKVYNGTVESYGKNSIVFTIPGVKDEIVCKENITDNDNFQNYLLTHNNQLLFKVRGKKNNTYVVSVIEAYYQSWVDMINKAIRNNDGIQVHIDELVRGGYLCHTDIKQLNDVTGKNYTHSVFIPGSHIVLNIENDFERWIGEDVIIVPQKFVDYHINYYTGEVEKSLVGSRKKVLQIIGNNNIQKLYTTWQLVTSSENANITWDNAFNGTVTGIINSQKKTGIFVELEDQYITGLANIDAMELINYKPGDPVRVKIVDFECREGTKPFVYDKNGILRECNIRPIFELV